MNEQYKKTSRLTAILTQLQTKRLLTAKKKTFGYLWMDKKQVNPIVEGKHLDHPELEVGYRPRMKIFRVHPHKDLPIKAIEHMLQNALDLYRKGIIKLK